MAKRCSAICLCAAAFLGASRWAPGDGRPALEAAPQTVSLASGMVIDHSMVIRPGRYEIASGDLNRPACPITGDNITVDFNGAELIGSPAAADPTESRVDEVKIAGGRRKVRVDYYEVDGFAELRLDNPAGAAALRGREVETP